MEAAVQSTTNLSGGDAIRAAGLRHRAVMDQLEAEITELWGHINAASCRFLELLAEFDRREGWAWHGCANCAHWLNWQCGIGHVAAREKVRVARALEHLPKIREAFRRGVISYSKVRAMTRAATPGNEEVLLNVAEHGTAAHVENLVRKYRWVERREEAESANDRHRNRRLYFSYDEDDSVVIYAKLPPEVGGLVRKAIEAAMAVIDAAEPAASEACSDVSAETSEAEYEWRTNHDPAGAKRADALRLLAESFLARESEAHGAAADRFQVVVHIDQALLARDGDSPPHGKTGLFQRCERRGRAHARDRNGEAARLRCVAGRRRRRRQRRAAERRPQDAQHSACDAACVEVPRRRLPFPGLCAHALHGRPSHQALGRRR